MYTKRAGIINGATLNKNLLQAIKKPSIDAIDNIDDIAKIRYPSTLSQGKLVRGIDKIDDVIKAVKKPNIDSIAKIHYPSTPAQRKLEKDIDRLKDAIKAVKKPNIAKIHYPNALAQRKMMDGIAGMSGAKDYTLSTMMAQYLDSNRQATRAALRKMSSAIGGNRQETQLLDSTGLGISSVVQQKPDGPLPGLGGLRNRRFPWSDRALSKVQNFVDRINNLARIPTTVPDSNTPKGNI